MHDETEECNLKYEGRASTLGIPAGSASQAWGRRGWGRVCAMQRMTKANSVRVDHASVSLGPGAERLTPAAPASAGRLLRPAPAGRGASQASGMVIVPSNGCDRGADSGITHFFAGACNISSSLNFAFAFTFFISSTYAVCSFSSTERRSFSSSSFR